MPAGDDAQFGPVRAELEQRCAAAIAAGKTVSLTDTEMAQPEVRAMLPQLLEELDRQRDGSLHAAMRVSGYTLLGEIGHGGMSTVHLARHDVLGRHVAIKIVPNWNGGQGRASAQLLREARAMAKVPHPNIVTIHDIVETGDTVAIAMEWVDGLTLAGMLQVLPDRPQADDLAVLRASLGAPASDRFRGDVARLFAGMLRDVARAVHAVHAAGLLHLDIKPSNVLVRRDGTPLLADFGVVREIDVTLTETRSFAGTPIYAAPEQLRREDAALGPTTDVYGLGITLYELLARKQPLRGATLTTLIQDVAAGRIPPLADLAQVPADLATIVHRAMAPEPARRYPTAAAFADDLDRFLQGRPVAARPVSRGERLQRWARSEPWRAVLAAVLLLAVPAIVALGAMLVAEMPRIAAARTRELRAQAYDWEQRGIQSLLIKDQESDFVIERLRALRAEDPHNLGVLACLMSLLGQRSPAESIAELAKDPGLVQRHLCLQLLQRRLAESRPFFDDAEVAALVASRDRIDMMFAILSRILEAQDTRVVEPLVSILPALDLAIATSPDPDPLLRGLQAWTAAQVGSRRDLETSLRALETLWPDDPVACGWRMLATDIVDPAAARAIGTDYLARHPGNTSAQYLIARSFSGERRYEEALATIETIRPEADAASAWHWQMSRAFTLARLGRVEDARKAMPPTAAADSSQLDRVLLIEELLDPAAATQRYREVIAAERPPLLLLLQAKEFAASRVDLDLLEAACERGFALHPQRAAFRWPLGQLYSGRKDYARALDLVGKLVVPRHSVDSISPWKARCEAAAKDWVAMRQTCERWMQYSRREPHRPPYYLGIALARLGEHRRADECLEQHLKAAREAREPNGPATFYIEALFERMWIRVDPKAPPELRDPKVARSMCTRREQAYAERSKTRSWMLFVLGEVQFANGDRQGAIASAAAAQAALAGADVLAPGNLAELVADAIARYRE